MIELRPLGLDGLFEIAIARLGDGRGFFSETWSRRAFAEAGVDLDFVQDNHSMSAAAGVLRGLHFQTPPAAQDKLVRVVRGAVFDVAVDIRKGSPTLGKWVGIELSARAWNQILIPKGFAHGFVTLEPETEVVYKVSAPYSREHDRAIRFDDPDIGVVWPPALAPYQLSDKDRGAPRLADVETGFAYP